LLYNKFECATKTTKWHFRYHLCKTRELTSTTYHPSHSNNAKDSIVTTSSNTNTTIMPSSHSKNTTVTNRIPNVIMQVKWRGQHLENVMDIVVKGHTSLWKAPKYWNIPLTSLLDHGKTRIRKVGPQGVLT
jgi:hypothetical protein